MVYSPCSEISGLEDFGLRLGSLNQTHRVHDFDNGEFQDSDSTGQRQSKAKEIHRGPSEVEVHDSPPMFFKIPYQSYLIPGEKMGLEKEICYLSLSGFIPDHMKTAVLGQPFLQNYLAVLDQSNMEIGLGAHVGSDAEIDKGPVRGDAASSVLVTLILLTMGISIIYFSV